MGRTIADSTAHSIWENCMRKNITLTITENCNLHCRYCYEHHNVERIMTYDTGKRIIDYEFSQSTPDDELYIEFFGGEPFLKFDLLRKLCEYIWSKNWGVKYHCYATTNGTLIHGEIKEWLYKNRSRFSCGLSLDGTREMHNANRSNSYDSIDVLFFQKTWPEQTVKMTFSDISIRHLSDCVIHAHKLGFPIACNLAYGINWDKSEYQTILEEELRKLISFYIDNPTITPCSMLNRSIVPVGGIDLSTTVSQKWCGTGTDMRTYDSEGQAYSCQMFMPVSIGIEKAAQAKSIVFPKYVDNTMLQEKCRNCYLKNSCSSCYGYAFGKYGNPYVKEDGMCISTKIIMKAAAALQYERYNKGILIIPDEEKYYFLQGIVRISEMSI